MYRVCNLSVGPGGLTLAAPFVEALSSQSAAVRMRRASWSRGRCTSTIRRFTSLMAGGLSRRETKSREVGSGRWLRSQSSILTEVGSLAVCCRREECGLAGIIRSQVAIMISSWRDAVRVVHFALLSSCDMLSKCDEFVPLLSPSSGRLWFERVLFSSRPLCGYRVTPLVSLLLSCS